MGSVGLRTSSASSHNPFLNSHLRRRKFGSVGTVPKLGKFGFLSLILGGVLPGSSTCLEGGVVRQSGNNDKHTLAEARPPCAPYSLRVGSPMQPPVSAAPPRNPWSTDNTSRLTSAQPLRDPDAAASYAAGISEYNLPRISLKILNPQPHICKEIAIASHLGGDWPIDNRQGDC